MEQSIRPFKSLSENEIMVKAYHAIEKPSSETAIVLAEIGIRYAALSAKVESYKSALDEAKDTINWMWKHMKEADGQTLLQVDVFNRPANALHIIESVIENNSEDWKTFTTEQVQPKVNVIETWKDEKEQVPQQVIGWPLKIRDKKNGSVHEANKIIHNPADPATGHEIHVWCHSWYGHHIIGKDCEWAIAVPQQGLVWVKTTERLPGWAQVVKWRHEAGEELPGMSTVSDLTDNGFASLEGFEWFEWFDEGAGKEVTNG
jgi:hypothetical protein